MNTQNSITQDFPSANEVDHSSPQTPQAGSKTGGWEPTPGPWHPVQNTTGMWEVKISKNTFGHSVATVSLGCPQYFRGDQEANARLIAAAPDLLSAVIHLMDRDWFNEGVHGEIVVRVDADKLRTAIHKATGKEGA